MTMGDTGADFTFEISVPGQTTIGIKSGYSYVHAGNSGNYYKLFGYSSPADDAASGWTVYDANDVSITLNNGGDGMYYATLYLPFDVTISDADAYTLTLNGAKTGLTLTQVADGQLPAGTPVLLRGTNATATATINKGSAFGAIEKGSLTGTYNDLTVTAETDYFLGANEGVVGFYKWDGTTLKANRAYLPASVLTDNVKGFALAFDMADAINALNSQEATQGAIFNLAGQRVNKLQRGVNIVNGKKVLVK